MPAVQDKETMQFLRGLQDKWKTAATVAKEAKGEFERFPDGKYLGRVTSTELGQSAAGRTQITWGYTIMDGEFKGQIQRKWDGLETEKNLEFLARDLIRYGYDPEDISPIKLPVILQEIAEAKPWVRFTLRTKGDYQNLFIQQVLGTDYDPDDEDGDYESRVTETQETPETSEEPEEEETTEEPEEEVREVTVGSHVEFKSLKGQDLVGVVKELKEETGQLVIIADKVKYTRNADDVTLLLDDTVE